MSEKFKSMCSVVHHYSFFNCLKHQVNTYVCLLHLTVKLANPELLASERSERDTIRGVQIRAGAIYIYIYIYMYGGTYATIVAHATHT